MITNAKRAYVGFLIGNRKFDLIEIKRDDEIIKKIRIRIKDFWLNYVLAKIAPAPNGTISAKEALAAMYPKEAEGIMIPDDEEYKKLEKLIGDYDDNSELKKKHQKLLDKTKQEIAQILGHHEKADIKDRSITYKTVHKHVDAYDSSSRYIRVF